MRRLARRVFGAKGPVKPVGVAAAHATGSPGTGQKQR